MQYNLTIQRQLPKGLLFNIGYNGSAGVHEFSEKQGNPPTTYATTPARRGGAFATRRLHSTRRGSTHRNGGAGHGE